MRTKHILLTFSLIILFSYSQTVLAQQRDGDITNAGAGTSGPGYRLDMQSSPWTTSGSNIFYNDGNVGIGTSSPTERLHVASRVRFGNLFIGETRSGGVEPTGEAVESISHLVLLSQVGYDIKFGSGGALPRMILNSAGNVGIGTTSPTAKLHVVGDGKITGGLTVDGTVEGGNIKAKYQDVAEWVESSQELPAGTVVVLDSGKSNQVIASTKAYDSRVAGVISVQPGLALGEQGEGRVLVAATGRVKVKVDASNGPIQIGDLLVTADKEGFAMKSLPVEIGGVQIHRPGTLIGKALEQWQKGTGEILVLLSLQ